MPDRNDRAADETAEAHAHGGSVWAPHDVKDSMAGVSWLSVLFGVAALVLAALDRFPLLAFMLAAVGLLLGLRLFAPRLTTLDKVLLPLGMLTAAAAVVVLLIRVAQ